MRDSSAGSGPSSAASGMPCTLPESEVAGVFMSPCASTHSRPIGRSRAASPSRRRRRPIPPRGCGRRRARAASRRRRATASARLIQLLAHLRDVADVFLALVAQLLRLGNRRGEVAFVDDRVAERGDALAEAGDAKRRRAHVDAAPAAAEIERHADDVNRLGRHSHLRASAA